MNHPLKYGDEALNPMLDPFNREGQLFNRQDYLFNRDDVPFVP
jgi:hypothetical protein